MNAAATHDSPVLTQLESVRVITTKEELQQALPTWLEMLDGGTAGHNVHNDPRMILFRLEEQPSLQPQILLVSHGDRLVCVAPFYIQPARFSFELSVWRILSIRARALRVFGESVILAAGADPDSCVTVIGEFLRREHPSVDYLQIYGMNQSDVFWKFALQGSALGEHTGWAAIPMRKEVIHRLIIKGSFNEFLASLSSGTRQTLRYSRRRFFSDCRGRIERFVDRSSVPQLMQEVDQIYHQSWQANTFGMIARNDAAQRKLFEQFADEGWLRSYLLFLDDEPVAYQLGVQYDRVYYLLECAYSQKCAAGSPGSVLTFCIVEEFHIDQSVDTWDFGFGDMPYKRSFGSVAHDAAIVYFVPSNRWRYILKLQTVLNSAYDCVRDALVNLRIDKFVRKLIKRQR